MEKHNSSLAEDLSHPDLVLNIGKVTLGERYRKELQKPQRDQEKVKILQAACALLNSGGGVIQMETADQIEQPVEMGQDLEMSLRELIQSSDLQAFFEYKHQGRCSYIFVKSWSSGPSPEDSSTKPRICSLSSSLYRRSGTSVCLMKSGEAFDFLVTRKKCKMNEEFLQSKISRAAHQNISEANLAFQVFQRNRLEYGEILPFPESQSVEFKQFSTKHIQEYVKGLIPEYISAFANSGGGYLFIGVEDKSRKVLGCAKDNVDCASLTRAVAKAVSKLPIVHVCSSEAQLSYRTKVIDVFLKEDLYGYVFAIEVEPFCCMVFSEAPSSWIVNDKKNIYTLTTEKWVHMMMDTDPDLQCLSEDFESQLSLSSGPPLSRPVYSKKGLEHKKDLQRILFSVPLENVRYTPESLWKELSTQHEGLEALISQQMDPFSRGILILSRSWAVDLKLKGKQEVICDALLIALNSTPILYTVLRDQDAEGQAYCTKTAFTLKQKLVNMGGYTGKVCVIPKVLYLSSKSNAETMQGPDFLVDYPSSYYLTETQQMETLLQALVIVLLGFRSFLSDQLGCEILNLLTVQQYEILSTNLRKSRHWFVHGLPGSGKTIMAMKIMEKIRNMFGCEADRILYICENQPLKNFIGYKGICQAVTRKTFMKTDFEDIQHIIVDEAQNFRKEDGDWYRKAKDITRREKECPGILWIFLDYFQTSHLDISGLPPLSFQYPREELTKVVRNANKIAQYLQEVMKDIRRRPAPNIPHGSLEMLPEAEWVCGIQGTFQILRNLTMDQIVTIVADKCKMLLEKGYSFRDIAVLVGTTDEVDRYKHDLLRVMRKKRVVQFSDANGMLSDHIVLDSIRRFSGLERNVVFGILEKSAEPAILKNILACLASRAKQQLFI
uniref:Schlafen family member 13 n=1 Tax=Sciurus vulgaris TaxID=55149 RepID=A0A8D2CS76_SCIVU